MRQFFIVKRSFLVLVFVASILFLPVFADVESFTAFKLSDDGGVLASYDKDSKSILVTGTGTISRDKWIELAKKVNDTIHPELTFADNYGGNYAWYQDGYHKITVSTITFNGDEDGAIKLPSDSSYFFSNLSAAEVFFQKKVDVSNVVNMCSMFNDNNLFNSDISDWDTSNVTNMSFMFYNARKFNQDLPWNTSNVTDMSGMFEYATVFNQDISNWDVSNVTNMFNMFGGAYKFNQDISNWNVSNVENMANMFTQAEEFNQDISNWDVSNVTDMGGMFAGAIKFNQDLSNWDVSKVEDMSGMFEDGFTFNGDISNWDVSNVEDMSYMFLNASKFNRDISSWDTSKVADMTSMFEGATAFSHDISSWNTNEVLGFSCMFYECENQDYINLLNRSNCKIDDYEELSSDCIFDGTEPSFVAFDHLPEFQWDLPYLYWISKGDGDFIKAVNSDKTFEKGKKYILEKTITSHIDVDDFQKVYDGLAVTLENIKPKSKDILGHEISGSWSISYDTENAINVGTYKALIIFVPDQTEKYNKASKEIVVTIKKADLDITPPMNIKAWQYQSLVDVRLPYSELGTWKFIDESCFLNKVGNSQYQIEFLPHSSNYNKLRLPTTVEVLPYLREEKQNNTNKNNKNDNESVDEDIEENIDDEGENPEGNGNNLPFMDVDSKDWFYDSVKETYANNILGGTSIDEFSPLQPVTRGMMITSIHRHSGDNVTGNSNSFKDVGDEKYYFDSINWGEFNNIVKGYGINYKPDKIISRQEMVTMLYRYTKWKEKPIQLSERVNSFSDVDMISTYAFDALNWAVTEGLIIGRGSNNLAPTEMLSRAELAVVLSRYINFLK